MEESGALKEYECVRKTEALQKNLNPVPLFLPHFSTSDSDVNPGLLRHQRRKPWHDLVAEHF